MVKNLSAIKLGDFRLKCNVARFVLEEGEIDSKQKHQEQKSFVPKARSEGGETSLRRDTFVNGLSFKEAFAGVAKGKMVEVDDKSEALVHLHGKAVVVRMASLFTLQNVRTILKDLKLHEGKIQCLGGLVVLIEFNSKDQASLAKDELVGVPEHFVAPEIWEGQYVAFEQIAWLKIYGTPMSLLDNKVVNDVGGLFGKVVKGARVERIGLDNSFQFIGVLVNHGNQIQEEAFLRWRRKTFKVEDSNDWLEDFVIDVDGYNSEEESSKAPKSAAEVVRPVVQSPVSGVNVQENFMENGNLGINFVNVPEINGDFPFVRKECMGTGVMTENLQGNVIKEDGNLLKRKKSIKKVVDMGQASSGGYPSSNERPHKEPKKVNDKETNLLGDDPFNLAPFILGSDVNVVKTRGEGPVTTSNSFQALIVEDDNVLQDMEVNRVDETER
ncbi:hypothetical protein HanXRQr2_Chr15g0680811 [Helianthus annuus]|uniref:DUF4283 domain-containing protein n=1 Tax=Helianthus annuus TaxID=4232 RepID=A0A9K3DYA7_HELAN|nr:hypothetical protein HanXRQr2_Chr15g0680811 [Helianthus annuus]KAJ0472140.1 hypothetical protein HanHA89_Chr15g0603681 [Helianthus annuus]